MVLGLPGWPAIAQPEVGAVVGSMPKPGGPPGERVGVLCLTPVQCPMNLWMGGGKCGRREQVIVTLNFLHLWLMIMLKQGGRLCAGEFSPV